MGNVQFIALVGDYARGIDSGNIEVFLVGEDLNFNYITQLEDKIKDLIGRNVSFYLSSNLPNKQKKTLEKILFLDLGVNI